jgi:ribonuclease HII
MDIKKRFIGGCDEVGYGCFFGPVVAASVVIEPSMEPLFREKKIRDSKQFRDTKKATKEEQRSLLSEFIRENAIAYGIGQASVEEIDELGIDNASRLAMKRSVLALPVKPHFLLVDGLFEIPDLEIPQEAIAHGDDVEIVISAASIVAKVYRDNLIRELGDRYPEYDLAQNKGYGTPKHREAIARLGLTRSHRPLHCRKYSTQYNQQYLGD